MTCLVCLDREDRDFDSGCGCDRPVYPPCGPIPPGLSALPPQAQGFPQLRAALLAAAGSDTRLDGWLARSDDDLGVMLLESWAYVLDIVHFYNQRHQGRGFLATAPDGLALARIAALIGYRPRQATGGSITVAALASDKGPAEVPAGLQLRSQGVPGIPPQIFEVSRAATIDPRNNRWTTAPVRPAAFADVIAFAAGAPGVVPDQIVAVTRDGSAHAAARVAAFAGQTLADGADYRVATLVPAPSGLTGMDLAGIAVFGMAQSASPTSFPPKGTLTPTTASSRSDWLLDSVYPQLAANDLVVVEATDGTLSAQRLVSATSDGVELGSTVGGVPGKATKVVLANAANLRRLHFRAVAAGPLTNPALTTQAVGNFAGHALLLDPPIADRTGAPAPDRLLLSDQSDYGALLEGTVEPAAMGRGEADFGVTLESTAAALTLPAQVHGNLLELTRGQTVANEVLGSANPAEPYQRFKLKRKPLTYFPDPARPGLVRPELDVRVNGILWTRADSFLSAPAGAQVYIVRHTDAGDAEVVFGTAVRPPGGVDNVTATYRYGAGAQVPPPGKLTQIVGTVPNLARIVAPLAVRGGSEAEAPAAIRSAAPRSTLAQGRAVSLADYAAIVGGWPGVIASAVDWAWVTETQRAGVCAWIICSGGDVSDELAAALIAAGDPLTSVAAAPAAPLAVTLSIDLAIDPAFVAADVIAAVTTALTDPAEGLLAPARATIGGALFRSRIAAEVSAVAGVVRIRAILANGAEMPNALQALPGHYLAFAPTVGGN